MDVKLTFGSNCIPAPTAEEDPIPTRRSRWSAPEQVIKHSSTKLYDTCEPGCEIYNGKFCHTIECQKAYAKRSRKNLTWCRGCRYYYYKNQLNKILPGDPSQYPHTPDEQGNYADCIKKRRASRKGREGKGVLKRRRERFLKIKNEEFMKGLDAEMDRKYGKLNTVCVSSGNYGPQFTNKTTSSDNTTVWNYNFRPYSPLCELPVEGSLKELNDEELFSSLRVKNTTIEHHVEIKDEITEVTIEPSCNDRRELMYEVHPFVLEARATTSLFRTCPLMSEMLHNYIAKSRVLGLLDAIIHEADLHRKRCKSVDRGGLINPLTVWDTGTPL